MAALPELKGYLLKKSRQGRFQKRWFEATSHYLTYYKNAESEKLLACIDLWRSGNIQMGVPEGYASSDVTTADFSLKIGDQDYFLRAADQQEATKWVTGLKARQIKPDGAISDTFSHHEEVYNDTSSEVSSAYNDDGRSLGPNSRPAFLEDRLSLGPSARYVMDRDEASAQELVGSSVRKTIPVIVQPIPPAATKKQTSLRSITTPTTNNVHPMLPPKAKDDKVSLCCGKCDFM
ncbi:hypothetical protein SDRG_11229 [Saprolegnia diclina VS20]|uniref:PH domain-containing protein n=1 Tax=Saprolegnia diclina (strain VS20) TaxID=1156394 RepID=T0RM62_SAPDV|nr:hypothetical protein SDRG_11229 [Saprolegnia diclina VS20]EQC31042.1 hypothetical protein SDRG_11229 [Saprolegnia diclina VS20]|eukprot:XP_008615481.1 hypothetical protein SDRG_11229 [Saprolegnia diclina VS20]